MKLSSLLVLPLLVAVAHLVAAKPTGNARLEASYLPPSASENEPRFISPVDSSKMCLRSTTFVNKTVSKTTNLYEYLTMTQVLSVTELVQHSKTVTSTRHTSEIQQAHLSHSIEKTKTAYVTNTKYITKPHVLPAVSLTSTEVVTFTMKYTNIFYSTVTTTLQETDHKTNYDHISVFVTDEVPHRTIIEIDVTPAPIMVTQTSYSVITATMAAAPSTVTSTSTSTSVHVHKEISLVTPAPRVVSMTKIEPNVLYSTLTDTKTMLHTNYGVSDISRTVSHVSTVTSTSTIRQTEEHTHTVIHTVDNVGEKTLPISVTSTINSVLYLTKTSTTTSNALEYYTQYTSKVFHFTNTVKSTVSKTLTLTIQVSRPASTVTQTVVSNTVRVGCSLAAPGYDYAQPSMPLILPQ